MFAFFFFPFQLICINNLMQAVFILLFIYLEYYLKDNTMNLSEDQFVSLEEELT